MEFPRYNLNCKWLSLINYKEIINKKYIREYNQKNLLQMNPSLEPQHFFTDWFNYIQTENQ